MFMSIFMSHNFAFLKNHPLMAPKHSESEFESLCGFCYDSKDKVPSYTQLTISSFYSWILMLTQFFVIPLIRVSLNFFFKGWCDETY